MTKKEHAAARSSLAQNAVFTARHAGLYLLMVALLLGIFWNGGYFPTSKLVFAGLMLVAGGWEVMIIIAFGEWRALRSPALWLLGAFALLAAASHGWTQVTDATDREAAMVFGLLAAIIVPRAQLLRNGVGAIENLLNWLIYSAAFVAAWGIITYLLRIKPYVTLVDEFLRAGSTFEYSNALSCFELMALPLTFALHQEWRRKERPLYATLAAAQIASIGLAFSRLGVAVMAAIIVYFLITAWRRRMLAETFLIPVFGLLMAAVGLALGEAEYGKTGVVVVAAIAAGSYGIHLYAQSEHGQAFLQRILVGVLVLGAAGAGLIVAFSERAKAILRIRFIEGLQLSKMLPHREDTWDAAWQGFLDAPLKGRGLGVFSEKLFVTLETAKPTRYAHNLVLQMLVDTGILGGLLVGGLLLYASAVAVWRIVRDSNLMVRALAIGALVFVFYNMFDWEWYLPAISAWFLVAVACIEARVLVFSPGEEESE